MSPKTDLSSWTGATTLDHRILLGRFVRIEPLDVSRHSEDLWHELSGPKADPKLFDHMFMGPGETRADFDTFLASKLALTDRKFYTAVDLSSGKAQALLALQPTSEAHGTMSLIYIIFGASMQRSPKTTETVFLLADETFALGYRRLEWTCSDENVQAKRAAERFGFKYDGIFRQIFVYKGRSWDMAMHTILDHEWPKLREGLVIWLAPENFDSSGRQIRTLKSIRKAIEEQENEKSDEIKRNDVSGIGQLTSFPYITIKACEIYITSLDPGRLLSNLKLPPFYTSFDIYCMYAHSSSHICEKSALMSMYTALVNWNGATPLDHRILLGRLVRIEPLDVFRHGEDLWQEVTGPSADPKLFDHMFTDSFVNRAAFDTFLASKVALTDGIFYTAVDLSSGKAQALLALQPTSEAHGTMTYGSFQFAHVVLIDIKVTSAK